MRGSKDMVEWKEVWEAHIFEGIGVGKFVGLDEGKSGR